VYPSEIGAQPPDHNGGGSQKGGQDQAGVYLIDHKISCTEDFESITAIEAWTYKRPPCETEEGDKVEQDDQ
jgi:hypothetical protein